MLPKGLKLLETGFAMGLKRVINGFFIVFKVIQIELQFYKGFETL